MVRSKYLDNVFELTLPKFIIQLEQNTRFVSSLQGFSCRISLFNSLDSYHLHFYCTLSVNFFLSERDSNFVSASRKYFKFRQISDVVNRTVKKGVNIAHDNLYPKLS